MIFFRQKNDMEEKRTAADSSELSVPLCILFGCVDMLLRDLLQMIQCGRENAFNDARRL